MSDLTPLKESSMTQGRGGYGSDFTPRTKNRATIPKDSLTKVLGGATNLSYDEMQKIIASLIIDA